MLQGLFDRRVAAFIEQEAKDLQSSALCSESEIIFNDSRFNASLACEWKTVDK